MRNVSRAWAFETGLAAGVELSSGEKAFFPRTRRCESYTSKQYL